MATSTQYQNNQNRNSSQSQSSDSRQNHGGQDNSGQNNQSQNHHGPVESFRLNNVSISIFENESEHEGRKSRYHRAKIDKRYRDQKSGEWKSTTSFSLDELLRLQHLINNAVDFMAQKPGDSDRE